MPPRTTNNDCKLSANNGAKIAAGAAKMKYDHVSRCGETLVCSGLAAHFQHESNWSSIFSPHFGQVHITRAA